MKKKENLSCPHCRSSVYRVLDKGLKKEIEFFQDTGVLKVVSSSCAFDGELYKFETDFPASFICKICGSVVKDPHLATCCGNQFCHSCICNNLKRKASTRFGHGLCRICRSHLKYVKDKEVEAEVNSKEVLCPNFDTGCQWTGELGATSIYLKHCKDCLHKRIRCEHCQFECTREGCEGHLKECKWLKKYCPNLGYSEKVAQEELDLHRDQCDFELVKCDYDSSICTKTMQRRNLKKHLRSHESSEEESESDIDYQYLMKKIKYAFKRNKTYFLFLLNSFLLPMVTAYLYTLIIKCILAVIGIESNIVAFIICMILELSFHRPPQLDRKNVKKIIRRKKL